MNQELQVSESIKRKYDQMGVIELTSFCVAMGVAMECEDGRIVRVIQE